MEEPTGKTEYPSPLIEACLAQGFPIIVALKTNQILYPKRITIQTKEFIQYIQESDPHFITMEEGNISCVSL